MTSKWLNTLDPERRRDGYYQIAEWLIRPGIVHALEPAFVPWATPYEPWLLHQLAIHPKFVGGKVSTLDEPHFLYWAAMCKDLKLDFAPHSGDDYGIATAIKTGLPLLIGAASSADAPPEIRHRIRSSAECPWTFSRTRPAAARPFSSGTGCAASTISMRLQVSP